MFVVIFEVQPKKHLFEEYLDLAKVLKPELENIDGFIDNERFASRRVEGRLLSLSTWRDEKALIRWRTLAIHHKVQEKGRFHVFEDYHLRVGEVAADSDAPEGQILRAQRFDATEIGGAKAATISELASETGAKPVGQDHAAELQRHTVDRDSVVDQEAFDSIYNPGKSLVLTYWLSKDAATRWAPCAAAPCTLRHRRVRIIRDYGIADRREAPQYYPPVQPAVGFA
jgi:heme-degrading monooxygenase HmoA